MCFLRASWEGDGFDSLEAVGQIPLWCLLVERGTEGVGVSWVILVFLCSNWELNPSLQLWLHQRRGMDSANLLVQQCDAPGTLLPSGFGARPTSSHQVLPVPPESAPAETIPAALPLSVLGERT